MKAEYNGVTGHYKITRSTREKVEEVIRMLHPTTLMKEWEFSEDESDDYPTNSEKQE